MNDKDFINTLILYQTTTATTLENRYYNLIYPTISKQLDAAINASYVYNLEERNEIKQIILLKSIDRIKTRINPTQIKSVDNYLFMMFKRLCLNEIDRLKRIKKKTVNFNEAVNEVIYLYCNNINYIDIQDEYEYYANNANDNIMSLCSNNNNYYNVCCTNE